MEVLVKLEKEIGFFELKKRIQDIKKFKIGKKLPENELAYLVEEMFIGEKIEDIMMGVLREAGLPHEKWTLS